MSRAARPGRRRPVRRRSPDWVLLGMGLMAMGSGLGLLAYVAWTVRTGVLDVRPKHAVAAEPVLLSATEEPAWFYGITGGTLLLAVLLLGVGSRMLRHALRDRQEPPRR